MKLKFLIPIVFLLAFTSSEKLQPPGPDIAHANRLHDLDLAEGNAVLHDRANAATGAVTVESWDKAKELGRKLRIGMIKDDKEAAQLFDPNSKTVQSVFDGDLKETLEKWGYNEPPPEKTKIDKECDFDAYHHIKTAFDDLGIDTRSKGNGGPNECFEIDHANGPKVLRDETGQLPPVEKQKYIDESCGKEYRVTWGTFEFAINPDIALIALLNVRSPAYSAVRLWGRQATTDELPHIRSISDIGWAFWNRACKENIRRINYLMVAQILNADTRDIIRQAHMTLTPPRSETAVWPGYDFSTETEAGQALLGSSVGRWVSYFLMQHKEQLGSNKYIWKVRVFKPDQGSLPFMLFYVSGPVWVPEGSDQEMQVYKDVIKHNVSNSNDQLKQLKGKHVLREHVVEVGV